MTRFLFLGIIGLMMLSTAHAQRDTVKRIMVTKPVLATTATSATTTKPILTTQQDQWLKANYKQIAGQLKDSARARLQRMFPSISEASFEYMINQATKLQAQDHTEEIKQLRLVLQSLQAQKNALTQKIDQNQNELSRTTDVAKQTQIRKQITDLQTKLKAINDSISSTEEKIRHLQ